MNIPWPSAVGCVARGPGSCGSGGSGADTTAVDVTTAVPMVLERCGG